MTDETCASGSNFFGRHHDEHAVGGRGLSAARQLLERHGAPRTRSDFSAPQGAPRSHRPGRCLRQRLSPPGGRPRPGKLWRNDCHEDAEHSQPGAHPRPRFRHSRRCRHTSPPPGTLRWPRDVQLVPRRLGHDTRHTSIKRLGSGQQPQRLEGIHAGGAQRNRATCRRRGHEARRAQQAVTCRTLAALRLAALLPAHRDAHDSLPCPKGRSRHRREAPSCML